MRFWAILMGTVRACSASLIVSVPTSTSWIVCADKGTKDEVRGELQTTQKIFPINDTVIMGTTGLGTWVERSTFRPIFDSGEIAKRYFLSNQFSEIEVESLGSLLRDEFQKFLLTQPYTSWPATANSSQNAMFQLLFFYVRQDKEPEYLLLRLLYVKQPNPLIRAEVVRRKADPSAFGNTAVWSELINGNNPIFDAERRDSAILALFGLRSFDRSRFSQEQGLIFAKRLIEITSAKTHLIETSSFYVGPTYDCAAINYERGLTWLTPQPTQ